MKACDSSVLVFSPGKKLPLQKKFALGRVIVVFGADIIEFSQFSHDFFARHFFRSGTVGHNHTAQVMRTGVLRLGSAAAFSQYSRLFRSGVKRRATWYRSVNDLVPSSCFSFSCRRM